MEIARMDYRFTTILILMLCALAFFAEPAYPRNDYLNNGTNTCSTGDVSVSIEQRDYENRYRHYDPTNNYDSPSDDRSIRLTYRKYLGSACTDEFKEVQQENMELKQQLELMKMCGKVNNNPTIQRNENFKLLVSKCSGIIIPENKKPEGSHWDDLKDNYKKENPDITLMGDSKLLMPKNINDNKIILPLPKPIDPEAEWNAID
jgi:hypothetical protein